LSSCRYRDEPAEDFKEKAVDGGYINGMFLEGARWDEEARVITDSRPKQLYTSMPVLHLSPVQHRVAPTTGIYRCPVYKILSRRGVLATTGHSTNFVMWIEVPGDKTTLINNIGMADQAEWIKAGAAGFLSLKF
jgi:dynein heavy chain, axonemal